MAQGTDTSTSSSTTELPTGIGAGFPGWTSQGSLWGNDTTKISDLLTSLLGKGTESSNSAINASSQAGIGGTGPDDTNSVNALRNLPTAPTLNWGENAGDQVDWNGLLDQLQNRTDLTWDQRVEALRNMPLQPTLDWGANSEGQVDWTGLLDLLKAKGPNFVGDSTTVAPVDDTWTQWSAAANADANTPSTLYTSGNDLTSTRAADYTTPATTTGTTTGTGGSANTGTTTATGVPATKTYVKGNEPGASDLYNAKFQGDYATTLAKILADKDAFFNSPFGQALRAANEQYSTDFKTQNPHWNQSMTTNDQAKPTVYPTYTPPDTTLAGLPPGWGIDYGPAYYNQ